MRAVLVVVAEVFREEPFQMLFIECDDVVQQVAAAASYPALRYASFRKKSEWVGCSRSEQRPGPPSVLGIAVEYEKPGSRIKRKCLPQLLDDPLRCGMFGDVEVQNASAVVPDDEKQ